MLFYYRVMKVARTARILSRSNIYHVMLRGINRQNIFEEDMDRAYFMNLLKDYKKITGFRLYAFVLMSNHIHLLIEPAGEPLDTVFRRIITAYAVWYNRKYQRTGHLFQDRFRSENVENEQYFITVLRYILQNPMKAGMESRPGSYRWSSFLAYQHGMGTVTDTQLAMDLFGSRETLVDFLLENNDDTAMDEADFDRRLRDEKAKEKIIRITQCASVAAFQQLASEKQKEYARKMYQEGMSLGQISRLTGMPKTTVFNAIKAGKDQSGGLEEITLREADAAAYDPETVW